MQISFHGAAGTVTGSRHLLEVGEQRILVDSGMFPSLATQMITVGEETGRLDEMLLKIGDIYEKKVRNSINKAMSLMEPIVILTMGIIVGFIVISMLMAIFSVNDMPF